jgi:hypothetical protein
VVDVLHKLICAWPTSSLTSVLHVYRVVSHRPEVHSRLVDEPEIRRKVLVVLLGPVSKQHKSVSLQALALNIISNFFLHQALATDISCDPEVHAAGVTALKHSKVAVRMMASALFHNIGISFPKNGDHCDLGFDALQTLSEQLRVETDIVTTHRLMVAIGHLCFCNSTHACMLPHVLDVDFEEGQTAADAVHESLKPLSKMQAHPAASDFPQVCNDIAVMVISSCADQEEIDVD